MDETYDMIRGVRDKQYKYLRNYQPGKPYAQYIDYMDQMPTLREWRHLNAQRKLEGPQTLFFSPEKPVEELYDVQADPHEVRNLASSSQHRAELERLRAEHEAWMKRIGDLGLFPNRSSRSACGQVVSGRSPRHPRSHRPEAPSPAARKCASTAPLKALPSPIPPSPATKPHGNSTRVSSHWLKVPRYAPRPVASAGGTAKRRRRRSASGSSLLTRLSILRNT
jgi:uncharacterized sulfatase